MSSLATNSGKSIPYSLIAQPRSSRVFYARWLVVCAIASFAAVSSPLEDSGAGRRSPCRSHTRRQAGADPKVAGGGPGRVLKCTLSI